MKGSKSSSPKKMKQKTLGDFLFTSSPPPISPPAPSVRRGRVGRRRGVIALDSDISDDMEQDSDVGAIKFEPEVIPVDVSDEDISPRRPSTRRLKKSLVVTDNQPDVVSSEDSLEDHIGIPVDWKGSKKGKRKRTAIADSDDEPQPRRRKLVKGARPPSPEGSVVDEVDENDIIESRLRARDKKTTFQKHLEKLNSSKGKKRSEITLKLESSESDAESSEGPVVRPFKGARPDHGQESESSSGEHEQPDEDDDFIVDDDEHGVLATQLPIAFSRHTHQDLAHHFKIICQLFVHMAVRSSSDRRPFMKKMLETQEYFSVPLQVARRKLSGMKDSLVTSSVWKPQFKRPLERYPKFELVRMKFSAPQCDACNLGGRVSTIIGRVSGRPYDKYDFESESEDESSSSSDTDSDDVSHKSSGKQFYLGRFCAARTRVFHEFSHWEYHLYHSLLGQIDEVLDDNRGFVRIAFAGGIEPPKDMRDADKVMDWLDQRGLIESEWQRVRGLMDRARNLEMRSKRGGDQDDQDI